MDSVFTVIWMICAWVSVMVARRVLKGWINPVSVYWGIWTSSIVVGKVFFFADWPLAPETWIAIIIAAVAFTFVALLITLIFLPRTLSTKTRKELRLEVRTFVIKKVFVVFIVCMVLEMMRLYVQTQRLVNIAGDLNSIIERGGYIRTVLILESAKSQPDTLNPITAYLWSYFLSLGGISLFLGAYLLRVGKIIGVLPLIVKALISITNLQRYELIVSLLIFFWSYWYFSNLPIVHRLGRESDGSNLTAIKKSQWILILTTVALTIGTWQVVVFRHGNIDRIRLIEHSLSYLGMPVWALDVRIRYGHPLHGELTYGASTMWGLAVWLKRLGFNIYVPPYHYEPVVLPGGKITNVFTYLINALDDWGWAGLILLPTAISTLATFFHLVIIHYKKTFLVPLQSVIMTTITMSFYTLITKELYYVLLLMVLIILSPILSRKVKLIS